MKCIKCESVEEIVMFDPCVCKTCIEDWDFGDIVDTLAQHRTDNVDMEDLMRSYYDETYENLEQYSIEELIQMKYAEIGVE